MSKRLLRVFIAPVLLTASSCGGLGVFGMSPDTYVPNGATITLNESVPIPRNSVAAAIRGGYLADRYTHEAHCRLEVRTLASEPRLLEPDSFEVVRTSWEWEYFGGLDPRVMYAALITPEGPSLFWYTTYIFLSSQSQPDVYRLRCRHLQESDVHPRYLTVAQIQQVLGSVMTIEGRHSPAQ